MQINSTDSKPGSRNLILVFTGVTCVFFGVWQHSLMAGLFFCALQVWAAHLFAYVQWKGYLPV